ncbi:ferric reductase like transmembrane component-domain-containing protein [Triangularia setosa]|uniref:Ferric reductase like transmembrane component-domain-containing protein n=1 Tax=Triangularia setosa TaxID=2587417 RepID=A0AAN7A5D6_9PEZI|nr:ferric reductase like transmembrane component-domain-containing protein [Podospora setosa]
MRGVLTAVGLAALALPGPAQALIGYGITMYDPSCGFGCYDSVSGYMLECSVMDHGPVGAHSHGAGGPTSPECRASDTYFLTTLAYCMNTTCDASTPRWKLEKFWSEQATGSKTVASKWSYAEALAQIKEPPTDEYGEDDHHLTRTVLLDAETVKANTLTREYFEYAEMIHSRYGLVLLIVGFGTPVVISIFTRLPYMSSLADKLKPYLVYPSLIGTYHVRPLPYLLGNAATVGQSLYVIMFAALNIAMAAAGYKSVQPNAWFGNQWQEVMGYFSARTGVLAFALTPLVILLSGRNNILLWATNWSHSTFMVLHRWVARIYAAQVIVHSIAELVLYIDMGSYEAEFKTEYWAWGIVATVFACAMLVFSSLFFRRWSYEVFLIGHIIMAVFVIAGSWYHVEFLFSRKWGYEFWLYAACAVWFFDRVIRVFRILKNGPRRAVVTEVAEDIVRVDVKGIRWTAAPGLHTYAYFPALSPWRPWENHPFSILPTALLQSKREASLSGAASGSDTPSNADVEKSGGITSTSTPERDHQALGGASGTGITLYVRKSKGLTKLLANHNSLLTLLDGPYPDNPTDGVLKSDRLLLIAGGVGITGVLPYIARHTNVKVCWSVRALAEGLVRDLEGPLSRVAEKDVRVGSRLDVAALLAEEERTGWNRVGVVVCGPGGLCDDTRTLVTAKARTGPTVWELEVDAFSW